MTSCRQSAPTQSKRCIGVSKLKAFARTLPHLPPVKAPHWAGNGVGEVQAAVVQAHAQALMQQRHQVCRTEAVARDELVRHVASKAARIHSAAKMRSSAELLTASSQDLHAAAPRRPLHIHTRTHTHKHTYKGLQKEAFRQEM